MDISNLNVSSPFPGLLIMLAMMFSVLLIGIGAMTGLNVFGKYDAIKAKREG